MKYASFSLSALCAVIAHAPLAAAQTPATLAAATPTAAAAPTSPARATSAPVTSQDKTTTVPVLPPPVAVSPAATVTPAPQPEAARTADIPSPAVQHAAATNQAAPPPLAPTYPWRYPAQTKAERQRVQEPIDTRPLAPLKQLFSLHVGVATLWNKDAGYDLFSSNDLSQRIGLMLEANIANLDPATHLGAQLGVAWEGSSDGSVPSQVGTSASLAATHPGLGLLLGHDLFSWLAVHGRAQAGYSFTNLRIQHWDALSSLGDFKSSTSQPFGALGAGVTVSSSALRVSKHNTYFNALSGGIRAEGGYLFTKAIHARLADVPADPPRQQIATRGADLGELNRKGVYLYLSAFLKI